MKPVEKTFIMLTILSICIGAISPVMAEDGNATNTSSPTPTDTPSTTQPTTPISATVQPTETGQTQPTGAVTATENVPGKFRVGPTVRIRPLNDDITKDQDGLIELYMDNPSLNDVTLSVDARISVPSGIHVYGQGFGEAGAAGMVYGKFEVPPGSARTINIVIKAEKMGDFNAQFSGLYWPGGNKDAYQPLSLTHPFKVSAPSADPLKDTSGNAGGEGNKETTPTKSSPGISIIVAISIIAIMAYILRRT